AWMDARDMAPAWLKQIDWDTFTVTNLTQDEVDRLETPIGDFLSVLTKQEFLESAIARQMLGYPVATVADIYQDRQLAARQFWQEVSDPISGATLKYPGGFAVINGQRLSVRRPAPRLGQHNREIYGGELKVDVSTLAQWQAAGVI